jgi:phosphohistidine phosphatase
MDIVIIRHATAEEKGIKGDEDRKLTREGRFEAQTTAKALSALAVKPDKILTSPLVRARETADILAKELGAEVEVLELLAPPGDPKEALNDLEEFERQGVSCLVLVGHNPSLQEFIGYFICANTAVRIDLTKAGAAGLSYNPHEQAQPTLDWLLRKKQLQMLAK